MDLFRWPSISQTWIVPPEVLNLTASTCMWWLGLWNRWWKQINKKYQDIYIYKSDILHQTWQALLDALCNNRPLPSICGSLKGIGRSVVQSRKQWPKSIVFFTMFLLHIYIYYIKCFILSYTYILYIIFYMLYFIYYTYSILYIIIYIYIQFINIYIAYYI